MFNLLKYSRLFLHLSLMVCLNGCSITSFTNKSDIQAESINVLDVGDRIVANNTFGTLTITADEDNKRYLTFSGNNKNLRRWKGDTVCVRLKIGELEYTDPPLIGLYCDKSIKKIHRENSKGYSYLKMKETKLYFDNLEAVEKWFGHQDDEDYNWRTWTSDGLCVFWSPVSPEYWFIPKKSYLHVKLFQIYVNGEKPSNLPDARDDQIKVESVDNLELQRLKKLTSWF